MSFSMWEVTEQNAKEMRALGASEQLFTWAKWSGEGKTKNMLQGNKMSMDTKSSTGSEGVNNLRY